MRYLYQSFFAFAVILFAISQPAGAERRALVIGNSTYRHSSKLENPKNDAIDLASGLKRIGFQVSLGIDLDKKETERILSSFIGSLYGAELGLFFYAGHAIQVGGENYLLPVDARLVRAKDIDTELVSLNSVQRQMEMNAESNVLIFDACRDNPLAPNLERALAGKAKKVGVGLAAPKGLGTLISFSTQPGNVAQDGSGRNSPFSKALIERIDSKADLTSILIEVRRDVVQATARKQVPWEHSALMAPVKLAMVAKEMPGQGEPGKQLSEKSINLLMQYGWALTPPRFVTPQGKVIIVDKSKPADVVVPIGVGREVISAARLTAYAELCGLEEERRANYQTLMRREEAKGSWTDQQLLYISQLHLITVMALTGKVELVVKDGDKQVVVRERSVPKGECTILEQQRVKTLIARYVSAAR